MVAHDPSVRTPDGEILTEVHEMGGGNMTMQDEENAASLATELDACIESALAALEGASRKAG
jgi:hypothetical protein